MLLVIIDYVKSLIDWYIDYRIYKREKNNKKRRKSRKDTQR